MKENSIETTIKQLELILKVRKEQKEIIEWAGGSCMNCDPDIKALSKSIEILTDYKKNIERECRIRNKNNITLNNELNLETQKSKPVQEIKINFNLKIPNLAKTDWSETKKLLLIGIENMLEQNLKEVLGGIK